MPSSRSTRVLLALLAGSASSAAPIQDVAGPADATPSVPGLVVVLNVDSMFPEQLERLDVWWRGGFRRLLDEGTVFTAAALPYAHTESAPGHASFGTGCLPSSHGITRDAPIDPLTKRQSPCVADATAHTISSYDWLVAEGASASAKALRRNGWAEALRAKWPGSRSISISGKGTSAVLLGGKAPDRVLWWDSYGRGFVSSSAYAESLPTWVAEWNASWPGLARDWSWEAELPGDPAMTNTAADARRGESAIGGAPAVFPYPAPELPDELGPQQQAFLAGRAYGTPLMDRLIRDLAERAVVAAELGADEQVDLLAISMSACDLLGQSAGPYSLEVTDALLKLDLELGELFEFLDERLGRGRWSVVFSSDHGLLELPEGDPRVSPGGVRLPVRARRQALQLLRETLVSELGTDFAVNMTVPADGVSLAAQALEAEGVDAERVRRIVAHTLESLPWVAEAYTREELLEPARESNDHWLTLARNSYHREGCGDVELRLAHRHLMGITNGTRAGSAYLYDRRQPLIFLGPGFSAQWRSESASSVDALPTLLGTYGARAAGEVDGSDLLRDRHGR